MEHDTGFCILPPVSDVMSLLTVTLHTISASGTWIAEQLKQKTSINARFVAARSRGVACNLQ